MINSMTGFGRGEVSRDGYRAVFEITSVNSRFLEVSVRLPRWLAAQEPALRAMVDERLSRGKIFCQLSWERTTSAPTQTLNEPLVEWYVETLRRTAARHHLSGDLCAGDLLAIPDLWTAQAEATDETIESILHESFRAALDMLQSARRNEGRALAQDLGRRLANAARLVARIEELAAGVPAAIRDRLTAKISELLGSGPGDPQRLAQEVAYMAERADITEECVRLSVHRQHFEEALDAPEAVGRRLNFLLQEMNREANTIGSKSVSAEISTAVVELKEELERIREQVQNIE